MTRAASMVLTLVAAVACQVPETTTPARDAAAVEAPPDAAAGADLAAADAGAHAVADAADEPAPEAGPGTCAPMVAACVAALNALKASCAADEVACTVQNTGTDQVNECYANGVRVYWDFVAPGMQRATVLRPDGRTCYTVEHVKDADALITDTVIGLDGRRVISKAYKLTWDYTRYACSSGQADILDSDFPCSFINVLPVSDCQEGMCQRP